MHIYIYIHIERERERERGHGRPPRRRPHQPPAAAAAGSPQLIFIHLRQLFRICFTLLLIRHCKHLSVVVYKFLSRRIPRRHPRRRCPRGRRLKNLLDNSAAVKISEQFL